jgi:predicted membrane channel-forming protein YqfA (hemolysin III family)
LAFGQHYPFVLLYVWYVFWVLGNIVGNALFGVCLAATSISEWRWVALLQLAFCTIGIVELICLYKLVKCYCGLEQNVPLLFDGCKSKGELPPMLPKV